MPQALFITEDRLKSYTGVEQNIDPSILYPFVLQSQDLYIQPILGTKLYRKIEDLVVDNIVNGTVIPTDYKTLLDDYITQPVVHWSYWMALPHIKYRTTNKGLLSGNSEVADSVSLDELQYLRNSIKDTAQFYTERLRDYLKAYQELYPEFQSYTSKDGMKAERGTSYRTGLVVPRRSYKLCDDCEDSEGRLNYPLN